MDYQRIYNQLILRAKTELEIRISKKDSGEYFEGHHIIPRCLGGTGKSNSIRHDNIAILTAREHFLAHWLLHRIYPNNSKIAHAFWQMCNWKRGYQYRITPNSRIYHEAKESIAMITSKRFKGCIVPEERKDRISKTLTGRKRPVDVVSKISMTQKGRIGTHKGWITVTNGVLEKRIKDMSECPVNWKRGRKDSARQKISEIQVGKIHSTITKQKISDSVKRYKQSYKSNG
jgi:hypothetical protein